MNFVGRANDVVFEDTKASGKPAIFFFGASTPAGLCAGAEQALSTMRAGGKRIVIVPSELGFQDKGIVLRPGSSVPPDAELRYELELVRVSPPPS